jgi:protein phosphatase
MASERAFKWVSSARTDVGKVRKVNEDACLARPDEGLWAVADGMGGHSAGDLASGLIVEQMGEVDLSGPLSASVTEIERRLIDVNEQLRDLASSRNISTIGSTFAGMVIRDGFGVCLWVGDSRVYRIRDGRIEQVSQDHAFVEDLVEKGILSREDAAGHPQSNLVTRAVGAQENLKVDVEIFELEHEDTYVLCSDGLDKEVPESDIVDVVMREQPEVLSTQLVEEALERGARDNVTVITITVRDPSLPELPRPMPVNIDQAARELVGDPEFDLDDNPKTDFGKLARSPSLMLDDEDVTIRNATALDDDAKP